MKTARIKRYGLFHELLDCFIHTFDFREVAFFDGMDKTVFEVLFDDVLADLVQFAFDSCQLDQYIRAVLVVFDHSLYFVQMADRTGQLVGDLFYFLRIMGMRVFVFHVNYYNKGFEDKGKECLCIRILFADVMVS